jgi:general stress protein 26
MPRPRPTDQSELEAKILEILSEHRLMTVSTVRPDGWPQATVVGYANDGLSLYFVTPRTSQKVRNIAREPRVSIAIGSDQPGAASIRGLSMAALASEVTDPAEVERLNELVFRRYPEQRVFSPAAVSVALLKAEPQIVSIIDSAAAGDRAELIRLRPDVSSGGAQRPDSAAPRTP